MSTASSGHVTRLLDEASQGSNQAAAALLPLVYDELRTLARVHLSRAPVGNTLQPTALVHEAYLRLLGSDERGWSSRRHFFGAAANAMRNILVDQARRKSAVKHGGDRQRVDLDGLDATARGDTDLPIATPPEELLALDQALSQLEKASPRQGEIVMLRFFAGLSAEQTARALDVSLSTIDREWRFIRAFLHSRVKGFDADTAAL
jgi:RNA polymerase sigma factor (TIGR02999 family)